MHICQKWDYQKMLYCMQDLAIHTFFLLILYLYLLILYILTHPVYTYSSCTYTYSSCTYTFKTLRAHFLFQLWTFSLFKDIMGQLTSSTMSCSVALDHQHSWRSPLDLAAGLCHLPCVQQVHGLAPGVLIEPRHEGSMASCSSHDHPSRSTPGTWCSRPAPCLEAK